jgi:transcriptional regulator GlxA family with amidase domain
MAAPKKEVNCPKQWQIVHIGSSKMPEPESAPVAIQMLVSKNTTASGLYGLSDVLSSVGIVWESLVSGQPADARFEIRIVAADPQPFRCATGGIVAPEAGLEDSNGAAIVLVPGISAPTSDPFAGEDRRVFDWLRHRREQGARVVSACTGALVLAEAGLLDGIEATTHWAYQDVFRRYYPRVRLRAEKNLCCAPDGTVTSGGTTAWQQLALYLIGQYCGREHAVRASKFWLLPDSGELQGPYAAMTVGRHHEDSAIRDSQAWIVEHFATPHPVEAMIAQSSLPPTTFARRFRRATGYAPMEYVHALRVEEAKQMLETSDCSVERIGGQVGYEDTASFRRLFKRQTGLTPREYRRLFGSARFGRYAGHPGLRPET